MPNEPIAALPTARIAAFKPGQSPPEVNIPTFFVIKLPLFNPHNFVIARFALSERRIFDEE
jgi:hypothetical protein